MHFITKGLVTCHKQLHKIMLATETNNKLLNVNNMTKQEISVLLYKIQNICNNINKNIHTD